MNTLNHAATGTVIALAVKQPLLALPLALASHYVLDALPHFGFDSWEERKKHKKLIQRVVLANGVLTMLFAVFLVSRQAPGLIYGAIFFAVLPDLAWVYRFAIPERMGTRPPGPHSFINKFHSEMQTRERPSGFYVEYVYAVCIVTLLLALW